MEINYGPRWAAWLERGNDEWLVEINCQLDEIDKPYTGYVGRIVGWHQEDPDDHERVPITTLSVAPHWWEEGPVEARFTNGSFIFTDMRFFDEVGRARAYVQALEEARNRDWCERGRYVELRNVLINRKAHTS